MNLSELSLRRPVMAIVLNIVIVVFGLIGYRQLGVRDYPAIDPPNISVRTSYSGANADIVESQITEPLEKSINGIPGIKNLTSTSSQGTSFINIEFDLDVDLESAANDVRDKVSQAVRQLPADIDAAPEVSKADASSDYILALTVQSHLRNHLQLTEFANNVLVERLQTIPGVSSIRILGEKKYAMRLWLDPLQLTAHGLTPVDVLRAVESENIELPAGKITGNSTELPIRTFGRLETEEEFNDLKIKTPSGNFIQFKDIGKAVLGPENEETVLKEKLIPMVNITLVPIPGANYVDIAHEFYARLEKLKSEMPDDITLNVATDQTVFIEKSIIEVEETLIISLLLVILIVYLFFRNVAIAFRPLIDIPVSLVATFFIMYVCGFSINVLTLLAIVLATGLVVDDGIVVTENIYRKLEGGMSPRRAALEGSNEIYFAVIATSITLAVVFIPVVFMEGFVGRLFREFGFVVAGAVLVSCFVSLTLTPVLSVKMGGKPGAHSKFYLYTEKIFVGMEDSYQRILQFFMRMKWVSVVIIVLCVVSSFLLITNLKSELAPLEDRSQLRIMVSTPEGTSFDYTNNYLDGISQFLIDSIPEARVIYSLAGGSSSGGGSANTGFVRVFVNNPDERERSQEDIAKMVSSNLKRFNAGRNSVLQEQTISTSRRSGEPVQFVVQNNDFEKLKQVLPDFIDCANDSNVLQNIDSDLKLNKPELKVSINRLKAAELGVTVADISQTLRLAFGNVRFGYFSKSGKQYNVIGQVDRIDRDNPTDLNNLFVRSTSGQMVSLDNLVTIEEITTPPALYHFNRYRSATISAALAPGHTIGDGVEEMRRIAGEVLDDSFATSLSGASRDFTDSSNNTAFAFLLALGLIYLVLAAQFESFVDPLVIMLTVPLAVTGALLTLFLYDQTLNIFSEIGIIMLIGLVTKNGILIVEFANQKVEEGLSKGEAVLLAARMRLRPILMTSLAMALGSLPLALSLGASSTSRVPLGLVIVGGVMFSLILTLFVIPAMFIYLSRRRSIESHKEEIANSEELIPTQA